MPLSCLITRKSVLRLLTGAMVCALPGASVAAEAPRIPAGYLFVTFKNGREAAAEQIYFGISRDGRQWEALNRSEPVLWNTTGELGVRDPYLIRLQDGQGFVIIGTDLSMARTRNWTRARNAGSRAIVIWESKDLVHWSEPRRVEVASADSGCAWAPEAVYDASRGDYLVFWASTTARDKFEKHAIWAARTADFKTFSAPFLYIDKPTTIIDTTIVHDGRAYYRFTKDGKFKAITMETAPELDGPWTDVEGFSLAQIEGYEGPQAFMIEPGTATHPAVWTLILDQYLTGKGYAPFTTQDLASGVFAADGGFQFPFPFRHGSILPLSAKELARVRAAYKYK